LVWAKPSNGRINTKNNKVVRRIEFIDVIRRQLIHLAEIFLLGFDGYIYYGRSLALNPIPQFRMEKNPGLKSSNPVQVYCLQIFIIFVYSLL
jgi:hypothetical protein